MPLKLNISKYLCFVVLAFVVSAIASPGLFCQINPLGQANSCMALDRQNGYIIMTGAALGSFFVSEFMADDPQWNYYQVHTGYYNGSTKAMGPFQSETSYHVLMQNFGFEREFSRWFSMLIEGNIQEMYNDDYFTLGTGLKTYYRWTFLRRKKLHPYLEYGAGIFYALDDFPERGGNFTFNLNYAVGVEYLLPCKDKIRLDLNFKHHSNNGLGSANPGFDGNGISFSYSFLVS